MNLEEQRNKDSYLVESLIRYYFDIAFTDCIHYVKCIWLPDEKILVSFHNSSNYDEKVFNMYQDLVEQCMLDVRVVCNDLCTELRTDGKVYHFSYYDFNTSQLDEMFRKLIGKSVRKVTGFEPFYVQLRWIDFDKDKGRFNGE